MKKLSTLLIIFMTLWSMIGQAQEFTVTGTVTAADDGLTLPGVTVLVKGTTNGTTTDFDGNYTLGGITDTDTLVFSFVGMVTQQIPVAGRTRIDVVLETESFGLDEVVVIGYGTVKKKDVTGSVSIVDSKVIEQLQPQRVEQALQGTATGVNVTQTSGAPGAGLDIRIRGVSTNGDASPVVIIDGYIGDLNTLSPGDIETITVLKDAQAAIYGTVGANGIILVTTKKGKLDAPTSVSLFSSFGIQETTRKLPVLDATEYGALLNESYAAAGQQLPYPDLSGLGVGTDWQSELFQTAPVFDNNIRISGGTSKMTYSLGGSDLRQEGIIGGDKSGYSRSTGSLNLTAQMTDWLKFNTSTIYTHIRRKSFNDFGLGSVLFNAVNMPAVYPVRDENGNFFQAPGDLGIEIINPLEQIANTFNDYFLNKLNGTVGLDASFAQYWTVTTRFGYNATRDDSKSFSPIVDYGGKVFDVTRNSVTQTKNNYNDYTFDAFINYDRIFGEDHHAVVTLGYQNFRTWGNNLTGTGFDIPNNSWDFADLSLANGLPTAKNVGSFVYDQRRLSYFGRLQYDYQGKYLASFMLRRDASTKFGPDNVAAYFPSATLGWIISDEAFMANAEKVDLIKFRLSYGILGSDKIGDYMYISQLTGEGTYVINYDLNIGTAVGALPNPGVKWEESQQFDVGLDFQFFNDRLDVNMDYFNKTTANLLIGSIPVSGIFGTYAPGASGPTVNAGTVRNQGFELAVGFRGTVKQEFSYRVDWNFTYLDNEVTQVNNGTGFIEGGSFGVGQPLPARMEVGFPIGYFFGYETDGIFQTQAEVDAHPSQTALGAEAQPGDIRYKDLNGDGVLDADDRTMIGNPIPKFLMGLNISLDWKNFDFWMSTYTSIGNDIVRNYERAQPNVNRVRYTLDRWTGPGTSNEVPRVTTAATSNNIFSDFYVEDGSYFRIQRVQLGYTLPEETTKKIGIRKVRFFGAINNLLTLSNYLGFDPAASSGVPIGAGFDSGFYPAARVYTFGFNLNI